MRPRSRAAPGPSCPAAMQTAARPTL
jgi:hypothetical protein